MCLLRHSDVFCAVLQEHEKEMDVNVQIFEEEPKVSSERLDNENFRYSCSLHSNSSNNSQYINPKIGMNMKLILVPILCTRNYIV